MYKILCKRRGEEYQDDDWQIGKEGFDSKSSAHEHLVHQKGLKQDGEIYLGANWKYTISK